MSPDAGQDLSIIEAALKRDRIIVLLGLAGIAILAWVYTVHAAWEMNNMDIETCMGLSARSWGLTDLTLLFLMWTVMMAAMMIPSVSQMVLLYAGSVRRNGRETGVVRLTGIFVLGYLASWTGFSLLATLAQWGLHEAALIEQRQRAEDRGAADAQARAEAIAKETGRSVGALGKRRKSGSASSITFTTLARFPPVAISRSSFSHRSFSFSY